jgi:hypothetical protein
MTDATHEPDIAAAFKEAVNMPPATLRKWLASDASRSVGMTREGEQVRDPKQPDSVGHQMGERILEIKATPHADLTEADLADMRKVVGYVKRHIAQRPKGDVTDMRWRHSLMNWGHDPLK